MNFRTLYDQSPPELKNIVISQWKAKQNAKYHPEGNTLKHIITVTNRAFKHFPDNPHIQLAAYFHDLGKLATAGVNPKTGQPTAYGHENEGVGLVDKYKSFITKMGADPDIVRYIVKNHMKIKPRTWDVMRQKKKDPIINDPSFDDLMKFGNIDKGGLNLQEKMKLKNILNELFEYKDLEQKFKIELDQLNSSHRISINMGMYTGDRPDTDPLKGKGYGKLTFVGNSEVMDGSFEKALEWVKKKGFEIKEKSNYYEHDPGERRFYPSIKFHFNIEDVPPTNP